MYGEVFTVFLFFLRYVYEVRHTSIKVLREICSGGQFSLFNLFRTEKNMTWITVRAIQLGKILVSRSICHSSNVSSVGSNNKSKIADIESPSKCSLLKNAFRSCIPSNIKSYRGRQYEGWQRGTQKISLSFLFCYRKEKGTEQFKSE